MTLCPHSESLHCMEEPCTQRSRVMIVAVSISENEIRDSRGIPHTQSPDLTPGLKTCMIKTQILSQHLPWQGRCVCWIHLLFS